MDLKARFQTFSNAAFLEVLLPRTSDFDAVALLRNGNVEGLAQAPTRRNLFFDEQANILVILKASASEETVKQILPHLELLLTAHATEAVPQGSRNAASASGKHELSSTSFAASSFFAIVPLEDKTYVVWKQTSHLCRPRARLQRPAVYFTVNLTINSNRVPPEPRKDHLESFEPLSANVLEPLRFDPALVGASISLPESRITKVAHKPRNLHDDVKPIRGASKRAFPSVPALFSKIRFSALPDAMIASVHVETSQIIAGSVTIDQVELESEDADIQPLNTIELPLQTKGGDENVALFRLRARNSVRRPIRRDRTALSVSILANASLHQGSQVILDFRWQTEMDLSQITSGTPYRWSQSPSGGMGHHRGLSTQSNQTLAPFEAFQRKSETEGAITFNFTTSGMICKGSTFKLNVLCKNRSPRARRFALLMLQPQRPKAATQSQATNTDGDTIAKMFSSPPLERIRVPDALDLSPDVRIGPLPPGACFETHMIFQALKTGVLDLGVLRILDLDTRQKVDVKELPDIVALDTLDVTDVKG